MRLQSINLHDLPTLETRLWSKVDRKGPDDCWNWTASLDGSGYGHLLLVKRPRQILARASRLVYTLTYGEIPDGLFVLHTCDNRLCVNPHHLYAGTRLENAHDALVRGRLVIRKGEQNPTAKLTDDTVTEARCRYAAGESVQSLAARYGVSSPAMVQALHGRTFAHLGNSQPIDYRRRVRRGEAHLYATITATMVPLIRQRIAAGEQHKSVAASLGISPGVVSRIIRGETWKHVP